MSWSPARNERLAGKIIDLMRQMREVADAADEVKRIFWSTAGGAEQLTDVGGLTVADMTAAVVTAESYLAWLDNGQVPQGDRRYVIYTVIGGVV